MNYLPPRNSLLAEAEANEKLSAKSPLTNCEPATDSHCDDDYENLEEHLREMRRMTDPHFLQTLSMTELYQNTYPSKPPIIEGLLYGGVYILAGAPKIGKSYLVVQLAYHVSLGKSLWNLEVQQGTVLYLALEDNYRRLQERAFKLYDVKDSPTLRFATDASQIENGLIEQLESFLLKYADTKLIIIDTLQKIRDADGKAYSYAHDYDIIGKLKQFADQYQICVLVVHHTRKLPAGDPFETISGTTGLLGCADGAMILRKEKRTALEATLDVVGRDQPDQILYLTQDPTSQIWNLTKLEKELYREPPDPILEAVARLVSTEHPRWTGSPSELSAALNIDMATNALTKHLNVRCGRLKTEYGIKYVNKAKHAGRAVTLTLLPSNN